MPIPCGALQGGVRGHARGGHSNIKFLRDATSEALRSVRDFPKETIKRNRVSECQRSVLAKEVLMTVDCVRVGLLMHEPHASTECRRRRWTRMASRGFGGCTVTLL